MRYFIAFFMVFAACNSAGSDTETKDSSSATSTSTGTSVTDTTVKVPDAKPAEPTDTGFIKSPVYANKRFKDVKVEKLGEGKFRITGKAQIFEANFSWYVEDGHNEIKSGHTMTDAGAPEWGNFDFTVDVKKARPNSTLHLVLFESSAKDGSRQYELPVLLY